jgi:hypothetical protein
MTHGHVEFSKSANMAVLYLRICQVYQSFWVGMRIDLG